MIRAYARSQGPGVSAYDIAAYFSAPGGIAFGAEKVFNVVETRYISVAALDATHFVAGYRDGTLGPGTAIVGEVSGTGTTATITYAVEKVFSAGGNLDISVAALDGMHFVAGYRDGGNSGHGTAIVGEVSGTGTTAMITYGAEKVFHAAVTVDISVAALDATHFVAGYADKFISDHGRAIVGEVSGTGTTAMITYGAEKVFHAAVTVDISVAAGGRSPTGGEKGGDPTGVGMALEADLDGHGQGDRQEHARRAQNPAPEDQRDEDDQGR